MRCFLMALFEKTKEVVQSWMGSSKAERISNFRDYMSKDQSMNSHGNNRYIFYRDVVLYATAVRCMFLTIFAVSDPFVV